MINILLKKEYRENLNNIKLFIIENFEYLPKLLILLIANVITVFKLISLFCGIPYTIIICTIYVPEFLNEVIFAYAYYIITSSKKPITSCDKINIFRKSKHKLVLEVFRRKTISSIVLLFFLLLFTLIGTFLNRDSLGLLNIIIILALFYHDMTYNSLVFKMINTSIVLLVLLEFFQVFNSIILNYNDLEISSVLRLFDVNRLNYCYIVLSTIIFCLTVIAIVYEKFGPVDHWKSARIELKDLNIKTKGIGRYFFQLSISSKIDLLFPIDFIICLLFVGKLTFPHKDYILTYVVAMMLFLYLDNSVTKFRYFFMLSNTLKERQLMSFKRMVIKYIDKFLIILSLNIMPLALSLLVVKNKGQLMLLLTVGILIIFIQKDIAVDDYVSLHVVKIKAQMIMYNKYFYIIEIPIIAQASHVIGKNFYLITVICVAPHIIYLIVKIIINYRRIPL